MMIKLKWDSEGKEQVLFNHGMLHADFAIENLSGLDRNIFFVGRSYRKLTLRVCAPHGTITDPRIGFQRSDTLWLSR